MDRLTKPDGAGEEPETTGQQPTGGPGDES
jgi:hypothetical protein